MDSRQRENKHFRLLESKNERHAPHQEEEQTETVRFLIYLYIFLFQYLSPALPPCLNLSLSASFSFPNPESLSISVSVLPSLFLYELSSYLSNVALPRPRTQVLSLLLVASHTPRLEYMSSHH